MEYLNFDEALNLMKQNEKENDVGIYRDNGIYDIITNGNGQNPIGTIDKNTWLKLIRKGYFKKGQCTNFNHRRFFYGFIPNPVMLQDLLPIETTDNVLDNKEFYLVPKGKKRVFINIEEDYIVTKFIKDAKIYTKQDIWDIYLQSFLKSVPYWFSSYGLNHVVYQCKGGIEVHTTAGERYEVKDVDLVTTDFKERYLLRTCIDTDYKRWLTNNLGEDVDEQINDIIASGKVFNWSVGIKCSNRLFSFSSWISAAVRFVLP